MLRQAQQPKKTKNPHKLNCEGFGNFLFQCFTRGK